MPDEKASQRPAPSCPACGSDKTYLDGTVTLHGRNREIEVSFACFDCGHHWADEDAMRVAEADIERAIEIYNRRN
jgi:hypothetical protein